MSLAVSAVIAPSRRLRCLVGAVCALLCATALVVGVVAPERFAGGAALACIPLFAALSLLRFFIRFPRRCWTRSNASSEAILPGNARRSRIDISGVGQLRVTVQQGLGMAGVPMTLLAGATVWPHCIVLRLRAGDGATWPLVIMPDAVGAGQYRALAVAERALAQRAIE